MIFIIKLIFFFIHIFKKTEKKVLRILIQICKNLPSKFSVIDSKRNSKNKKAGVTLLLD